jgi:hypothetical protein
MFHRSPIETSSLPTINTKYLVKSKRVGEGGFAKVYFAYFKGEVKYKSNINIYFILFRELP